MIDNTTLSAQRRPKDQDAALRPKSLGEFAGQEAARGREGAGLSELARVALTRAAG